MSWTYSCPHCAGMLNPDESVVLLAEHRDRRVLVGFHPEPGNYQVYLPPGVDVEAGSVWDFFCPVCQKRLVTDRTSELCALDMETGGQKHRVLFSPVAGDKATFVVSADGPPQSFGKDHQRYIREVGWGPRLD